jgi:hypothetical protein
VSYSRERARALINLHCRRVNGFAVYDPGWSDTVVTERSFANADFVRHLRQRMIGMTRTNRGNAHRAEVERLYDDGHTCSWIGRKLGLSTNIVAGLCFRHRQRRPKLPRVTDWKGLRP